MGGRMNFPKTHYLSRPAYRGQQCRRDHRAWRLTDFWAAREPVHRQRRATASASIPARMKPDTKLISINSVDLNTKANYQDFQRFQVVDIADGRGRRSDAAGADRSGAVGDPERPQGGDRKARRGRQEGLCGGRDAHQAGRRARLGREPDQHRAAGHGDSTPRSRTSTGRWSPRPATSATGRSGCGRWRSTTTGSVTPAAMASATARRPSVGAALGQPRSRPVLGLDPGATAT